MQGAISLFLIILGSGQLMATVWQLRGASLVGGNRVAGVGVGGVLLLAGCVLLPASIYVVVWIPVAVPLAILTQLLAGSYILPLPPPDRLFAPNHPAHGTCKRVQIPDGNYLMPALYLSPPVSVPNTGMAVCIVPGAGDTKTFFKWRLVRTLLASGFTVLAIDPPGHGEYRHRRLTYPDCLASVSVAARFLRLQPGINKVGMVGISLGGAMAINALAASETDWVDALVVVATPIHLKYRRFLFYRELWNTYFRAPTLSLLREMTVKQAWDTWQTGGYRSNYTTSKLFDLLNPQKNVRQLAHLPILLIYSRRDSVASLEHALAMQQAAPHAARIESKKASHVMLTLMPEINWQIALWLKQQFS